MVIVVDDGSVRPRILDVIEFFAYLLTKLHDQILSYRFSRCAKTSKNNTLSISLSLVSLYRTIMSNNKLKGLI